MKYHIRIGEREYEVEKKDGQVQLEGKNVPVDLIQTSENEFHLVANHQSYTIEVVDFNPETKEFTLLVNGKKTSARLQNEFDLLLAGMGMQATGARKTKELKAPMPGLVVDVLVKAGQAIEKGQPLVILEAMKMENVLKAANDVTIKGVEVTKGNAVEKNQVLITYQ
ncbi:MAG: acetyl-CoA carboxylase biotin carboxyl carrier protein subunit [Flavobacteriales bacterium]